MVVIANLACATKYNAKYNMRILISMRTVCVLIILLVATLSSFQLLTNINQN